MIDTSEESTFWKWDERAVGLMKFDAFAPLDELLAKKDVTEFGMEEHIQSWFLVDYLMHARKEHTAKFLRAFKDPFHQRRKSPDHGELVARQTACFGAAFGVEPTALEAEWRSNTKKLKHRKKK